MPGEEMEKAKFITFFIIVLFIAGCCNALVPTKNIKIPPYVIEYYHYDDPEKPTESEKESEGWYGYTWDNGFKMDFKVTRVEESGVYFYRVLYRATNPLQKRVTLFDQNIELMDSDSSAVIEQLKCWNWQMVSEPCNVAYVNPEGETSKEIRFGFSTEKKYAKGIKIHVSGLSFDKGVVSVSFYAETPKEAL